LTDRAPDQPPERSAEPEPQRSPDELERENRRLQRRLQRLEDNVRRLEEFQDSNSTLLSRLLRELEEERAKSQRLLLNILPQRIIDRLAAGETLIADRHPAVSVLFSDFVGFTRISSRLPPADLIEDLNGLFTAFDGICDATGVEKIKTVGDAYLVIGGLAGEADHGAAIAETALRMVEHVAAHPGATGWRIRVGLHEGPVVAGVIGTTKFAYDVWGDTVNVAARLETASEPNRIHVSGTFAAALEGRFRFEPRGELELKGKGLVATCFLNGRVGQPTPPGRVPPQRDSRTPTAGSTR
jgi:adenylate cyclase